MKKILGLDLGTNSIGWAVINNDFEKKEGQIIDAGSRIIPMSQDILGKFDSGQSISQTADRTKYRGTRRLYQRENLRRERLHRVLNILGFLPEHYKEKIDFEKKLGQFKEEVKLNYRKNSEGKYEFIFMDSFNEMIKEFREKEINKKIPYDWTLYYLRKKALKEKISKEELAWVLLNFNQKRGYYQLRGDELDKKEEKDEKYYALIVKTVKETEDKNAKGIWYEVRFEENNWVYKRQSKDPLFNWVGMTKEFIVTKTIDKKGNIKRSFRAPKEDDWTLIKKKTEQDLDNYINEDNLKTVGTYIYETLLSNPNQKIRGKLIKTIERKYYKKELKKILDKQIELQAELFTEELYKKSIKELYTHNDAHRNNLANKGFSDLFIDDIIFYQRPLKSQKSNIGGCQYESRTYMITNKETGKAELRTESLQAISKSHPLFQEFRLWQFISNLRIFEKEKKIDGKSKIDVDITNELFTSDDDWVKIFDYLNDKKEIKQSQLIDYLTKEKYINKTDKDNYRWNYVEDKTYPMSETRTQILSRLKKVSKKDNFSLNENFITQLWHIIYSVSDKAQYLKALKTFARKKDLEPDSFVAAFEKFPPFKSDYGSYSEKAIKKLLQLMRRGKYWNENNISHEVRDRISNIMERVNKLNLPDNPTKKQINEAFEKQQVADDDIQKQLIRSFIPFKDKNPLTRLNTYQAAYAVYDRHSESSEITKWHKPEDIDLYLKNFKQHSLRNPIVEQVVTETLRTVRDIWKAYGNFDEIHLELGREMKNPADKRKSLTQKNIENENTNFRIKQILKELMNDGVPEVKNYSPSHQEILKIYEEGVFLNPDAKFNNLSEDDVVKIRKNPKPSKKDIIKYKLWLEQGYVSPYTGKVIPLNKLFSTDYQIEHVIPQSRYFDNSLSNKVICESEVNQDKGNKTAYEYIKDKGGSIIEGHKLFTLAAYEEHTKKYFSKNRAKLKKLLSEDIPDGFIERQINDSRYISKLVKSLLSNIVRDEDEQSETSKHLIPVTGAITSKLKQDWGLNDKWNEIILPRFKRLNKLTGTENFTYVNTEGTVVSSVPDDLQKGFNKKRIDHRHHALDAMVIACTNRKHIQYLNSLNNEKEKYELQASLLIKNEKGHYTKHFQLPWQTFPVDVKNSLDNIIVSFKQNLRVINKATNRYYSYKDEEGNLRLDKNGKPKKGLIKQKGENWAIRKPMHTPLPYGKKEYNFSILNIIDNIGKRKYIADKIVKKQVEEAFELNGKNIGKTKKYLKQNSIKNSNGKIIEKTLFNISDIRYRKRQPILKLANRGKGGIKSVKDAISFINKISDRKIREDLLKHLLENNNDIDKAFSIEGIISFNQKRKFPIYKLPISEASSGKFPLGNKPSTKIKFGEAEAGTNLYFAVYETTDKAGKKKRVFETIPLNIVIEHQKQAAHLPKEERSPIPEDNSKGKLLFTLSPNDLVYVPTDEELENINSIDFSNLSVEQKKRIYKMVSSSGTQCFFIRNDISTTIQNKFEFGPLNKTERDFNNKIMIKDRCIKLKVNRLGKIEKADKY